MVIELLASFPTISSRDYGTVDVVGSGEEVLAYRTSRGDDDGSDLADGGKGDGEARDDGGELHLKVCGGF